MIPNFFFIATQRRSGAHLLMSLLNSTKKVGYVAEHLYPAQDARANGENWTDKKVVDFFENVYETVKKKNPSPTKHCGTKIDILDLFILERYFDLIQIAPQSLKWIWLCRRDKPKQAISYIRATRTGIYRLGTDSSPETIARAYAEINIESNDLYRETAWSFLVEDTWRQFFNQNEITPHQIYYEDFIEESRWESIVAGIFDFLGIPYSLPLAAENDCLKQSTQKIPESYKDLIRRFEKYGIPLKYTNFDIDDMYEPNLENR